MCSRFSPRPFDITLLVNWFAEHNEPEASFKVPVSIAVSVLLLRIFVSVDLGYDVVIEF